MVLSCAHSFFLAIEVSTTNYTAARRSPQRLQQCLGLLEVSGVKTLGEPAVDLRQHLPGSVALALALPQATQAHGRSQFPRLGLLAAGNVEGLMKTGFGFSVVV